MFSTYSKFKCYFCTPQKHQGICKNSRMTAHPSYGCRDFTRLFFSAEIVAFLCFISQSTTTFMGLIYWFVNFWITLSTPSQRDAWKKLKLPKVGKGHLKLSFFLWFTLWWNHLRETDWLGVGKDIKEILKFYKNELKF